ncbi:MAG: hypothetical protein FD180_2526 [Planctomycetota bacterium]|nr:MAG: hypothetical protein FD180_2526 [Planctomycetota bacterium]
MKSTSACSALFVSCLIVHAEDAADAAGKRAKLELVEEREVAVPDDDTLWSCDFSRDGRWLAVSTNDRLDFIDLKTGAKRSEAPKSARYINPGVSGSEILVRGDSGVEVRDASGEHAARELRKFGKFDHWTSAKASPDGKTLLLLVGGHFTVAPVGDGEAPAMPEAEKRPAGMPREELMVIEARWHPDSTRFAFAGDWDGFRSTGGVMVWSSDAKILFRKQADDARIVAWNPNGSELWWGNGKELHLLESKTWTESKVFDAPVFGWWMLGGEVALGAEEKELTLWHTPTMTRVKSLVRLEESDHVKISPDGGRVCVSNMKRARVFSIRK